MTIPPELAAALERILAEGRPLSIEEVNARMQAEVRDYNARPQRELGGLSPDALYRLLEGDWRTTGPLRIAEDVPADLVRDVPFLADARTRAASARPRRMARPERGRPERPRRS